MIERAPVEVTNLDGYGFPAMPWSRPRDLVIEGEAARIIDGATLERVAGGGGG